jgi:hypothetical protein
MEKEGTYKFIGFNILLLDDCGRVNQWEDGSEPIQFTYWTIAFLDQAAKLGTIPTEAISLMSGSMERCASPSSWYTAHQASRDRTRSSPTRAHSPRSSYITCEPDSNTSSAPGCPRNESPSRGRSVRAPSRPRPWTAERSVRTCLYMGALQSVFFWAANLSA